MWDPDSCLNCLYPNRLLWSCFNANMSSALLSFCVFCFFFFINFGFVVRQNREYFWMFSKARKRFLCVFIWLLFHPLFLQCMVSFVLLQLWRRRRASLPLVSVPRAAWIVILPQEGRHLSDTPIPTQEAIKQGGKLVFIENTAGTISCNSNMRRFNISSGYVLFWMAVPYGSFIGMMYDVWHLLLLLVLWDYL